MKIQKGMGDFFALDIGTNAVRVLQLAASGGDDRVKGTELGDTIYAGSGNDYVKAEGGDDFVSGGSGNDFLIGDEGPLQKPRIRKITEEPAPTAAKAWMPKNFPTMAASTNE